jgi:hypothetical protein
MPDLKTEARSTAPSLKKTHQAGDVERFAGGQVSYLAPLPLPTGQPAEDYAHAVGEMNDAYMTFGVGLPAVFGWQLLIGLSMAGWIMMLVLAPLVAALLGLLVGVSIERAVFTFVEGFEFCLNYALVLMPAMMLMFFLVWRHQHLQHKDVIPMRCNRQRRELCMVPEGHSAPIFVPWESVSAWVIEASGVSQYGVQRQYSMGLGFYHAESDKDYSLEFECGGLPLAIANWEALRAYMEYEVNSLKEIQDPLDLQHPDDPPHEGLHTFHNARERMRRRYREKEVGLWYVFGWYLYHWVTLWTLPFHLTEWEVGRVKKMHKSDLPEAMQKWSQPLPAEQWAKPSAELRRQTAKLDQLMKRYPQRPVLELFAEVGGSS